ncbi:MAG: PqqD family protein [Clostridiaceae bacterium]
MLRKNNQTLEKGLGDPIKAVFKLGERIKLTEDESGIATLWQPQDHKIQSLLRRLKFKIPAHTKLTLDEYGSFVIKQMDGIATVETIGIRLTEKFGSSVEPLYERLIPYIEYLEKNRHLIEKVSQSQS